MVEARSRKPLLVAGRGAHHKKQALFGAFVLIELMIKLDQQVQRLKIGAVRLEQRFEFATGNVVSFGFNQIANGLEVNLFVKGAAIEPKRSALSQRAKKPNQVGSNGKDEANNSRQENDAGQCFVSEGRAEFDPRPADATEQHGKQKHLGGAKKA